MKVLVLGSSKSTFSHPALALALALPLSRFPAPPHGADLISSFPRLSFQGNPICEALARSGHLVYAQTRSSKNVAKLAAQERELKELSFFARGGFVAPDAPSLVSLSPVP